MLSRKMTSMPKKKKNPQGYQKAPRVWPGVIDRSDYEFTYDYFKGQEYNWWSICHHWYMNHNRPFHKKKKSEVRILEVGAFEGSSTVWFIEELVAKYGCELHCVDRWLEINPDEDAVPGSAKREGASHVASMVSAEQRFDSNVKIALDKFVDKKDHDKVVVWKGDSTRHLYEIEKQYGPDSFDIIYIDGSHEQNQVLIDGLLAYKLLSPGGFIVFDDYQMDQFPLGSVKLAVDIWYQLNRNNIKPLYKFSSKDPDHPMYDGAPQFLNQTRNETHYLDASQAWFRKLTHTPSKARNFIPGYVDKKDLK